jgi:osmoprotectant transport system substrate-binding protein
MVHTHANPRPGLVAAIFALAALLLFVAGCGGDDDDGGGGRSSASTPAMSQPGRGKPPVTIGTKDFTEEFVLGELYRQALEARGYTVDLKRNIGPTEITDKALTSKQIDAYPEYTGITTAVVAKDDTLSPSKEETARRAKAFYEKRGQTAIGPTPFQNVDAVATTKAFAQEHKLKSLADLKRLSSFSLGARPEFKSRTTGLVGMHKEYGIANVRFKQVAIGLQYRSLDNGDVDSANVFSTDAQLASGKYAVLEDPKGVFGFQQVYFVIDRAKYAQLGGREFAQVIESVNGRLTNAAMRSMNAAVDLDRKDPAVVAGQFLRRNSLGGGGS